MRASASTVTRRVALLIMAASLPTLLPRLRAQTPSFLAPAQARRLRGTVVNSITHEPVPHALVYSPDNKYGTMADDQGRFEFALPEEQAAPAATVDARFGGAMEGQMIAAAPTTPTRPWALIARKPGYLDMRSGVQQQTPVDPDEEEVEIPLTPEARVIGHVLVSESDGADKIEVSLYRRGFQGGRERWSDAGTVRARANGEFRMAQLEAGTYKLLTHEYMDRDPLTFDPRGQLYGYLPVYYPAAADFETASAISLAAGETFQADLKPSRRAYYRVKLKPTNVPGRFNSQVEVWPLAHPGPGYALGYDFRDATITGTLPDGAYTVTLRSYGPGALVGMTSVTVNGGPSVNGSIAVAGGVNIQVKVREELRQPRADFGGTFQNGATGETFTINPARPNYLNLVLVPVSQFDTAADVGLRQPTGADDATLVFEGVSPGRYQVEGQSSLGYISAMTSGSTDLLRNPLVVGAGAAPEAIEITVRDDGGNVEGVVIGAEQAAKAPGLVKLGTGGSRSMRSRHPMMGGILVYFLPMGNRDGQFREVMAGSDGKFLAAQLHPGVYRVLAFEDARPELQHANEEELRRYDGRAQVIEVGPEGTKTLRLELQAVNE